MKTNKVERDDPLSTKRYEKSQTDCEHESWMGDPDLEKPCPTCGMYFVYCSSCSQSVGDGDRAIYHDPPACLP